MMLDRKQLIEEVDLAEEALKSAYSLTFNSEHGQVVLHHLFKFCGMDDTCMTECPRETAYLLGQRSVFLFIEELMKREVKLTEAELQAEDNQPVEE